LQSYQLSTVCRFT